MDGPVGIHMDGVASSLLPLEHGVVVGTEDSKLLLYNLIIVPPTVEDLMMPAQVRAALSAAMG